MPKLRVRFSINKGRHGAPMGKLGRISEQAEKFLRSLASDCKIPTKPGEWLAANFKNGSVEYDAEIQEDVNAGALEVFCRSLEVLADFDPETDGLNLGIRDATVLEYAKIGTLIDADEIVGLGIYPVRGGKPKWRHITYNSTSVLRRQVEAPIPSYGSVQGILHAWLKEAKEPNFQLRELSSDTLIRVFYPSSLYSEIADAVKERTTMLLVAGNMLFDRVTRSASELRAERVRRVRMLSGAEFEQFFGSAPAFISELDSEDGLYLNE